MALLCLIPGIGETLRVNGAARLTVNPELLESFALGGKPPGSVILVTVERLYLQCQKALRPPPPVAGRGTGPARRAAQRR